ncbi:MAG: phosphate--acyl-ACP acyltransferase [Rikenellaceae bacterium]
MLKIGIDAMGGDNAPKVVIEGVAIALDLIGNDSRIVLYGDSEQINIHLAEYGVEPSRVDIVHTTQVIEMGDHPAKAFVSKSDSSIVRGFEALAKGEIDGFASAGSTGAMMVGSMQMIGVIEGVIRPTITSPLPSITGNPIVLLDVGLNVDCKPDVLAQYGLLGSIYAEKVYGYKNPRVAILNIGEEEAKGNAQAKAAHTLMKEQNGYNFVGNVESSYMLTSKIADVVVCDGFVGNTILKMVEGLYRINKALGAEQSPFWSAMNYENVGGTPVLGVKAPVIIGHGSSSARAIASMITSTERTITSMVVQSITEALK